jgi:hypothetical protein
MEQIARPTASDLEPKSHNQGRRPFGLKAIITLQALLVVSGVFIVAVSILALNLQSEIGLDDVDDLLRSLPFYVAQLSILVVLRTICVIGLWRYKRWAWFLMMLLLTYSMAVDIVAFFRGTAYYLLMLFNVIMVFYLNQRDVQELFEKQEP